MFVCVNGACCCAVTVVMPLSQVEAQGADAEGHPFSFLKEVGLLHSCCDTVSFDPILILCVARSSSKLVTLYSQ